MLPLLAAITFLFTGLAHAAVTWTAAPFNPASVPLAVRTPYLSAWLPQGSGTALNANWPTFWTGQIVGWAGYVRVDGTAYSFLGTPGTNTPTQKAVQKSFEFTSTQSTFVLTAGPVDITVNFLSPVEPNNLVQQSLPFSYLSVTAAPNDGKSHSVQVYTDISAEWISGDLTLTATWNTTTTGDIITHQVQLQNQQAFTENRDRIQQGSAFYSIQNAQGTTFQSGEDQVVRSLFVSQGSLNNTQDTNFRAVQDRWPVFGLSRDLGSISSTSSPVVFSIGHVRDPAVQYIVANGALQERSTFFWTKFSSVQDLISSFLPAYSSALSRAKAFDAQDSSGAFNASDVLLFMKEISSDGNVNTVDVIFPSWPLFLYTNPTLGKQLLLPLFEYQATGQYPNKWSVHDMGANYPKALGHNDGKDEPMPVEESGNMLIMTLSYTQRTNDKSLVTTYFDLLDQWTQFLITDSLIPANQISTDDFAGSLANQTNLAIKGIIGIKAMSEIAALVGDNARASNYSSIASSYVSQWQNFATSSDKKHLTLSYGDDSSWGLSYNLYADKLLGTNIFPSSVFEMQTAWYSTVANSFGVPLDTRHTYTKSDWEIWTSALVTSATVRNLLISSVRKYAEDGKSSQPLGDWYETTDGSVEGFRARPVVGGHLALLALSRSALATTTNGEQNTSSSAGPVSTVDNTTSQGSGTSHTTAIASITISSFLLSTVLTTFMYY
ncbi:hypothetical protein QCA50_000571 [Cerrena zonata]|uniref:Glutaminase A central domain-containing protein n=1 Tax=Cerrena zonata TaxID=2478898 RepID=A0AAW0GTA5_9APHY